LDKDPRKEARRVFRQYGAVVVPNTSKGTVVYEFPDMARVTVYARDHHGVVVSKIREVKRRYGEIRSTELTGLAKASHAPRLDLENLSASDHAKDRLRLMQSQAKVTFSDVLHALRLPERTLWSDKHESWVWIRHPIAVAVRENYSGIGHTIVTVLWSDNELFDLHPRPKEAPHG